MTHLAADVYLILSYLIVALITAIGLRYLLYYHKFFFRWRRFRQLERVGDDALRALPRLPFVKVQITTRGSPGSTEVIRRGIRNVRDLVAEAPDLYRQRLSVEVVTESAEQKALLDGEFAGALLAVQTVVLPAEYATPNGTALKARGLHYLVELRRRGFNRRPGRTFIVHYDEESVMVPDELRQLIYYLARTDKKLLAGPIVYPLEYQDASPLCRAMEAHRPLGCYECQDVLESGTPLHLHGSNLVVDEDLENEIGWDIGNLDGQPFISEDYVFGTLAFVRYGPSVFGWHGCVMLEQPPFSVTSAFRQRYRWIFGVLQGLALLRRLPEFQHLPPSVRRHLVWGTRYRVASFAVGLPVGLFALVYQLYQGALLLTGHPIPPLPAPLMIWLLLVGFMWLNASLIGAWYNLRYATQLSRGQKAREGLRVLALAPIAGIIECSAGFWAVTKWLSGERRVAWTPTPKTKSADRAAEWGAVA